MFAGLDVPPDLASSLTLRLPASCPDGRWGLRSLPLVRCCGSLPALHSFGNVPS